MVDTFTIDLSAVRDESRRNLIKQTLKTSPKPDRVGIGERGRCAMKKADETPEQMLDEALHGFAMAHADSSGSILLRASSCAVRAGRSARSR